MRRSVLGTFVALWAIFATAASANLADAAEGTYPIPYQRPTRAEIVADLDKVRTFLENVAATEVIDSTTRKAITDRRKPIETAVVIPETVTGTVERLPEA